MIYDFPSKGLYCVWKRSFEKQAKAGPNKSQNPCDYGLVVNEYLLWNVAFQTLEENQMITIN